jgi:hypothetical protein
MHHLNQQLAERQHQQHQNGNQVQQGVEPTQLIAKLNGNLVQQEEKQIQLIAKLNGNLVQQGEKQIL